MAQVLNEIFQLTEIKRSTFDFIDFRFWLALSGFASFYHEKKKNVASEAEETFDHFASQPLWVSFSPRGEKLITIYLFFEASHRSKMWYFQLKHC